ncbi:hypothetical protein HY450_00430 [Candidatus Pacearchaeota archaeon]|nr:hypothetical protein [Candidatus Pacearchaeota archaeon]
MEEKREYCEEIGSTGTLVGTGIVGASLINQEFFENLREGVQHARHLGKTAYDFATGGPEGMKAARNLEEALAIVGEARENNSEARAMFEDYFLQRREFVGSLVNLYRENETISRVAERLKIQIEGTLKNFFEAGNSLKPEIMETLDDKIIELYGMNPAEARESSGRLKEFYKHIREFYDAREKNEHVVKEFCNYLADVKNESVAQNERFNELFPDVIVRVREGYETEDILHETGDKNAFGLRGNVSQKDLDRTGEKALHFERGVDNTYDSVREEMPIEPYSKPVWIDYSINPVVVGICAGLTAKGLTKLLPAFIEKQIKKTLALPFTSLAKGLGYSAKQIKKLIEKNKNLESKV